MYLSKRTHCFYTHIQACSLFFVCPTLRTHTYNMEISGVNLFPPASDYRNWPMRLRKCVTDEAGVAKLTPVEK